LFVLSIVNFLKRLSEFIFTGLGLVRVSAGQKSLALILFKLTKLSKKSLNVFKTGAFIIQAFQILEILKIFF
jgi:hypothetical protein